MAGERTSHHSMASGWPTRKKTARSILAAAPLVLTKNWQILSTIGQWLTSQALPFIIEGDLQVEPPMPENSGWVRAVGGFVVAPKLATVKPSQRIIDFFVSRDFASASAATTRIPEHGCFLWQVPKPRHWPGRPAKAPGATSFHVAVMKWSRLKAQSHCSTAT